MVSESVRIRWTALTAILLVAAVGAASCAADDSDASVSTTSHVYALKNGDTLTVYGIYDSGTLGDYTFTLPSGFSVTGTNRSEVHITCGPSVPEGEYSISMKRTVNGVEYTRSHTIWVNSDCTSSYVVNCHSGTVGKPLTIRMLVGILDEVFIAGATVEEGRLAPGMSVTHDDFYLTISGTPAAAGLYVAKLTVDVSSDDGDGIATYFILMDVGAPPAPSVTLISGFVNTLFSKEIVSDTAYTISIEGCDWLSVPAGSPRSVTGIPTVAGTWTLTVHYLAGGVDTGYSSTVDVRVSSVLAPTNSPGAGTIIMPSAV